MTWPLVKLSDICEINIGKTPSRANAKYWGKGHPWLSIADMKQGRNINFTKEEITDLGVKESNIKLVTKGTVLFSFKLSIGKIGITQRDMHTNEAIAAFPIKDKKILCENFLIYALSKMNVSSTTDRAVMGATLNKRKLAELKIPLPPLKEQKRIATILDKADKIRRKRAQAIQLADEFLRSVFLDMFGDPLVNNKRWVVQNLSEVTEQITDGKHGNCEDEENSGYFFISAKDIYGGKINYGNSRQINKTEFQEVHNRTNLKSGDIVMVNTGATIGKMAVVVDDIKTRKTTFQKSVAIIKLSENKVLPEFLKFVFELRIKDFSSKGSGSAVKNLLLSEMRRFTIIVPPLELQEKFQTIVQHTYLLLHKSEKGSSEINNLFHSLTQKAFSGEL